MIDLTSYKPINLVSGKVSMTVSRTGVSFSQAAVMQLGRPEFVEILISATQKSIIIKATNDKSVNRVKFFNKHKKSPIVRWNNAMLKNEITNLMDWNLDKNTYKIEGEFYPTDSLILFDLTKAQINHN